MFESSFDRLLPTLNFGVRILQLVSFYINLFHAKIFWRININNRFIILWYQTLYIIIYQIIHQPQPTTSLTKITTPTSVKIKTPAETKEEREE